MNLRTNQFLLMWLGIQQLQSLDVRHTCNFISPANGTNSPSIVRNDDKHIISEPNIHENNLFELTSDTDELTSSISNPTETNQWRKYSSSMKFFTKVSAKFTVEKETYVATLQWFHGPNLKKKKISSFYTDPPSFEHSCELHVHNSCMLLSPCRCIEKIARHAQEHLTNCWPLEKEKGPFCHLLFPRCLQSDTNFRYIFSPNNC